MPGPNIVSKNPVIRALTRLSFACAFVSYGMWAAPLAQAQAFADAEKSLAGYATGSTVPAQACSALGALALPEVVQLVAEQIPASGQVPAHCRVTGMLAPEIVFEVNLPASWNNRFYMVGNGGHAGQNPADPFQVAMRNDALIRHFVMASTNTGHDASQEPGASFVLSNPQKAIDYAYRAVHLTALTSKAIATALQALIRILA